MACDGLAVALGLDVETIVKDLEVYREDVPPPGYSLDTEVDGVMREADARDATQSARGVGSPGATTSRLASAVGFSLRITGMVASVDGCGAEAGYIRAHHNSHDGAGAYDPGRIGSSGSE